MAKRKEYIRVRVSNLEEYIAHMMAHPRVGYYHDAWIELAQQIGANLDMDKIIAESIEFKRIILSVLIPNICLSAHHQKTFGMHK